MTYVSETTYGGLRYRLHNTAEEAVNYILSELGPDYRESFWASDDGKALIQSPKHNFDFSALVHDGLESAVMNLRHLDPEVMAAAMRVLADAIDEYEMAQAA